MNQTEDIEVTPVDSRAEVLNITGAKLRKFLYELAEGTRDYRSLHNLTEQVEHQYHGRFVVELIQNAHDALIQPSQDNGTPARIEFSIRDEGPHGVLYVANDGRPFSQSNFESLSQLGNSDKNPQDSIGNKGIGFRSVLEITNRPAIYSRSSETSQSFDGYCFQFSPNEIRRLIAPILELYGGDDSCEWGVSQSPLVDWETALIEKFRRKLSDGAGREGLSVRSWVEQELKYLSPYMLPIPVEEKEGIDAIDDYEKRGFSSVIRLPLKSSSALELARQQIKSVESSSLIFLSKVSELILDLDDGWSCSYIRSVKDMVDGSAAKDVHIEADDGCEVKKYRVWTSELALSDSQEDVRSALAQLPGKWGELEGASVSVAVRMGGPPERGKLSIFLPTLINSGCWAHINAPFYGDMSRTLVDFGTLGAEPESPAAIYNRFLLSSAAELSMAAITKDLVGKRAVEGNAIIDLISINPEDTVSSGRWQSILRSLANQQGVEIPSASWMFSNNGWMPLNETSLLPDVPNAVVFERDLLCKYATFSYFTAEAESRRGQIENLAKTCGFDADPIPSDLAESIELIANNIHSMGAVDWNGFWADVDNLLHGDFSSLQDRRVLIGNDGDLHATGKNSKVFFSPQQGLSEDEEVENEGDVKDIPGSLRPFVAFLADEIKVYEGTSGRQETHLRKLFLKAKLVIKFRREDIFNEILLPRTPSLPVKHTAGDATICQDILHWGLQLLALLLDRGKGDRLFPLLQRLPAPCVDGWYPLNETSFGVGWPGTNGAIVSRYLSLAKSEDCNEAKGKLLLPAGDSKWGQSATRHLELLQKAGVYDGLRLTFLKTQSWESQFFASRGDVFFPRAAPPHCLSSKWAEYRVAANVEAKPSYNNGTYRLDGLYLLPGIDQYEGFEEDARVAFMDAVLVSAPGWPIGWEKVTIDRINGASNSFKLQSYLFWELKRLAWLGSQDDEAISWSAPPARWYVPTDVSAGRRHHFSHLSPLSGSITERLHRSSALVAFLEKLGMPRYNLETKGNSKKLLEALNRSVESGTVENADVFLGQVRAAWTAFEPENQTGDFPERLLVQRTGSGLKIQTPTPEDPVYLPDFAKFLDSIRNFDLPMLAIETRQAQRLANSFELEFPNSIIRTSSLTARPLVNGEFIEDLLSVRLRDDEVLSWLPPVLLTIAAYHGSRARGTATNTFHEQILTLRDTSLSTVDDLRIQLFRDEEAIGDALTTPAFWDSEAHRLLLLQSGGLNLSSASESFSAILERDDLDVPIKLVLRETGSDFNLGKILAGFSDLGISEEQYREVLEFWRGDVKMHIEWLIPVVTLLKPDVPLGMLVDSISEEDIFKFLASAIEATADCDYLQNLVITSDNMFDFGFGAYRHFGAQLELSAWNEVLESRKCPFLVNQEYINQFQTHLNLMLRPLRCLLAKLLHRNPSLGQYTELYREVSSFEVPTDLQYVKWEIGFTDVWSVIFPVIQNWDPGASFWNEITEINDADQLAQRLQDAGIDLKSDPLEVRLLNRDNLKGVLREIQLIGLAWAVNKKMPNASVWEGKCESYFESLESLFETVAYFEELHEADIWLLIMELRGEAEFAVFFEEIQQSAGIEELKVSLGVTADMLINATSDLDALREETRRKDRLIKVCGEAFDTAADNLGGLWKHMNTVMPSELLGSFPEINFRKTQELDKLVKRTNRKKGGASGDKGRASFPKVTKSMEQLIGLSGEIHAFRRLQAQYGKDEVNASSWVSSYSALIGLNAEADIDDGMGCDFKISSGGATYHIEVKSSGGVQESFKMGSSEIRLAIELAKKHVRGVYLILKVNEALSDTPTFDLLPNPYDPRYEALFEVVEADARIRYKSLE